MVSQADRDVIGELLAGFISRNLGTGLHWPHCIARQCTGCLPDIERPPASPPRPDHEAMRAAVREKFTAWPSGHPRPCPLSPPRRAEPYVFRQTVTIRDDP